MPEETEYAQQYKGQNVVAVRDACATDPGYEEGGDQVVCTMADGTVVTLKKDQLTSNAPASAAGTKAGYAAPNPKK
jgi:hypothetical protein